MECNLELESRFDGVKRSPQAVLSELMVMRQAKKQKLALPPFFWNSPTWRPKYKSEISKACILMKYFEYMDILVTLEKKENSWINTLFYKNLIDLIKATELERKKLEQRAAKIQSAPEVVYTEPVVGKAVPKKNKLSILEDME